MMDGRLFLHGVFRFLSGVLIVMLLLFLTAGTIRYPQAVLLICILFIPMFLAGLVMAFKNPELLRMRLNLEEKESEQRIVVLLSGVLFLLVFISAGICFRFRILMLPFSVSIIASVIFLIAYAFYAEVLRENTYLSRTVEVQEGQRVIDTGMYGFVRHPMYMVTVLLFLMIPLVLGSLLSFFLMLAYIPIIMKRIRNEEKVLKASLPGYGEYMNKVRYRLFPFIW